MVRVLALLAVVAVAVSLLVWSRERIPEPKVSGFVEADEIRLGSRVGGRVKAVRAVEGAAVRAGDVLVELEPFDLAERRASVAANLASRRAEHERLVAGSRPEEIAQAKARLAQAAARVDRLVHGPRRQEIDAARAQAELAQAQAELAKKTFERTKSLVGKGASEEDLDRATEAVAAAEATLRVRRLDLAVLEEGSRPEDVEAAKAQGAEAAAALELLVKGARAEDVAAAKAAVDAAVATLAALDRQVEELTIRAPVAATVDAVDLREGDLVGPNAPVLSLIDGSRLWVRAYVPEDRLDLKTGAELPVSVDAFPGRRFKAHLSFVASQGEFTPGNVQTPQERAKQVFRVKVQLDEGLDVLRPGMSADVWLPSR